MGMTTTLAGAVSTLHPDPEGDTTELLSAHPSALWLTPPLTAGPSGDGISIGSGTAITVTAEGSAEYVFFQSSNGTVSRGAFSATSSGSGKFDNVGDAISGARLASAYFEGGTVYMFQNSTEDTTIWLSNWNVDGNLETSQRLPGTGGD